MPPSKYETQKRLAQLKKDVPTRGIERHPLLLKNVSELDAEVKSPAVTALAASETIQTIVAFPPHIHRGWHYVPKQALLFTPTSVIHVLASIWLDQEPQITHLNGSGLMYTRVALLLLYGSLEIVAQGTDSTKHPNVEFNTVAWHQLSPPLQQLLETTKTAPGAPADQRAHSSTVQEAIAALPLKFINGLQIYGLLPGEALEEWVFQPGDWKRWLFLFRRPLVANTLLLLTSNYVVAIQDDLEVAQGWIIAYIPRNGITGMQCQPRGEWNELTIQLQRGEQTAQYTLRLKDTAAQTWRARWLAHGGHWQDLPGEV